MPAKRNFSLAVQGMSCASCVGRVERGLARLDGIESVSVNLAIETAQFSAGTADQVGDVIRKLENLGYPARIETVTFNIQSMSILRLKPPR